jgi:hypothetical protein
MATITTANHLPLRNSDAAFEDEMHNPELQSTDN